MMSTTAAQVAEDPAEEQRRMLRESALAFAANELKPARMRTLRTQPVQFDRKLWKTMAEMGWTGLMLPEANGGSALGIADMSAVVEELSRSLLPEPLVASAVFAGNLIAHGDNDALKAKLLAALVAGDLIPAVAFQEGLKANSPVQCRAEAAGKDFVLNGVKNYVRPGAGADGFVVSAKCGDGLGLFWIAMNANEGSAGAELKLERSTDCTDIGTLTLKNVKVGADHVVASAKAGAAAFERAYNEALIASSAELLGLMRGALDMTVNYLQTRVQFGKPIGSFQALQHRAVDLYLQQELSAAALNEVAGLFEQGGSGEQMSAQASRIKARASDAAMQIARESIQMHGAIGFTDEYDVGFYFKRIVALSAWLGNSAEHRRRYAAASGIGKKN
jgi:alkylation response protein AidB-like acyl-CoA dehydrogenase